MNIAEATTRVLTKARNIRNPTPQKSVVYGVSSLLITIIAVLVLADQDETNHD
jgi:hypothetical protein